MKCKYWKTSRYSGGASRKYPKTTARGQSSPLSSAAIGTIDRYSEELKNMPYDDKNALIEFLRNCPAEQLANMEAAQVSSKGKFMMDFVYRNFRGIHIIDALISPEDPLFSDRDDPQAMEAFAKANFLSDAKNRDFIRAQAKTAAENRKLRDKYFDMLRHVTVDVPFDTSSYQLACQFFPLSADDFAIAEFLKGVQLYMQTTQVTLRIVPSVNPLQDEFVVVFTEDQLLNWIDEIESSIEVTESTASQPTCGHLTPT